VTLICVPIPVTDPHLAAADAAQAKQHGADLIEFRIDEFFSGDHDTHAAENQARQLATLISQSPLPCIVTCRTAAEGGHYDGPEDARIALFEHLARANAKGHHPPRYIDVEHSSYTRSANLRQKVNLALNIPGGVGQPTPDSPTSLILSLHDTRARPADLLRRLADMYATPAASIVKVAYTARSLRDSLELLDLTEHAPKPTIALAMGEFGLLSRVLAPKFRGFLTFAPLRPASATAPGQPTLDDLLNLYRVRSVTPDTRVYGVIGYPVAHSLSPLVHNAAFAAAKINAVYLPLPIAPGPDPAATDLSLKATLLELIHHPRLHLRGVSVTFPFKESLIRLAAQQSWGIDPDALAIGAANTLTISEQGAISLSNTDAPATQSCLESALGTLAGKHIAILGAGGVASAAAHAAARAGARLSIYARQQPAAESLAARVRDHVPDAQAAAADWNSVPSITSDAIINGTPVGMTGGPAPGESPIPDLSRLGPSTVVMDTVYSPVETPLLRAARAAGLATIDGVSLFTRQAAAQFALWTGSPPEKGLFERLVRDRLRTQEEP
jgi:3-dehydroquinate dehydratase/shikimate dehydrogenase